ncbi:MAG: RecQ family ATP-dependent DNA helicase [Porphyromonadaceae bacterium]|nr:RecQ family ATP-dependent DNA helicase [Porphyromonadaceae bacterium]
MRPLEQEEYSLDELLGHEDERDDSFISTGSWPEDLFDLLPSPPLQLSTHDPRPGIPDEELSPEEILERYWGYKTFRPLQREIIQSCLDGRDTLGLMPTGGGKSITFQVPGLLLPGLTIVITPLISLMKDQVDHLRARGVRATAIHSGMSYEKVQTALDNCLYGRYKFLYISPERAGSSTFHEWLQHLQVSLIVVDECHCVCQWGYDFRPSYLELPKLRPLLPDVPILALTATATEEVVQDIIQALEFRPGYSFFKKSFLRPNVSYSIRYSEDKSAMMRHILGRVAGAAIIYCRNRQQTQIVAEELQAEGISATYYHAGLTYLEREMRQSRWMRGEIRVMVATNAFGMGIDKPDVRLVIHLTMPTSLEEYYQEAGRAGRDGERSYAVAIISQTDDRQLVRRLEDSFPEKDYIRYTFDQLCSFLSIGEGEGLGQTFDFDDERFLRLFHMRPIQTRHALEIMQLAGWIQYNDDGSRSLLHFLLPSKDLYQPHIGPDKLIRAILRTYTGLFSDYVVIDEGDLARLTDYSEDQIYAYLTQLSRQGVLHYIPKKQLPRLRFLIRREDSSYLRIPYEVYQKRKERMAERIGAVRSYIAEGETCRSRLLLHYFGEEESTPCGLCDVCLRRHPSGLNQFIIDALREELKRSFLSTDATSYPVTKITETLPYNPLDLIQGLRYLAQEQEEGFTLDGTYLVKHIH